RGRRLARALRTPGPTSTLTAPVIPPTPSQGDFDVTRWEAAPPDRLDPDGLVLACGGPRRRGRWICRASLGRASHRGHSGPRQRALPVVGDDQHGPGRLSLRLRRLSARRRRARGPRPRVWRQRPPRLHDPGSPTARAPVEGDRARALGTGPDERGAHG